MSDNNITATSKRIQQQQQRRQIQIPESMLWTIVFIPAVFYFISTRIPSLSPLRFISYTGDNSNFEYGTIITNHIILLFDPNKNYTITEDSSTLATTTNNSPTTNTTSGIKRRKLMKISCHKLIDLFYVTQKATSSTGSIKHVKEQLCTNNNTNETTFVQLRSSLQLIYNIHTSSSTSVTGNNNYVMDMIYRYDSNLGRGYILYTTTNTNRIWRYEIGNGLFTIGNTLYMDHACCRSNQNNMNCSTTSSCGPLVLEYSRSATDASTSGSSHNDKMDGKLLIAEYGEERIVRYEEEYGTRTPIIMSIPCITMNLSNTSTDSTCSNDGNNDNSSTNNNETIQSTATCTMATTTTNTYTTCSNDSICKQQQRLPNPYRMIYTPQGHLLVVLNNVQQQPIDGVCTTSQEQLEDGKVQNTTPIATATSVLLAVPDIGHIKPFTTLQQSREAHYWDDTTRNIQQQNASSPYILYSNSSISWMGSIALSYNAKALYGCAKIQHNQSMQSTLSSYVLYQIDMDSGGDIDEDDDDDNDEDKEMTGPTSTGNNNYMRNGKEMKILFDLTINNYTASNESSLLHHRTYPTNCAAMVIGRSGILYITVHDGILLFDPILNHVVAKIPIYSSKMITVIHHDKQQEQRHSVNELITSHVVPTAMTLSDDGYLYVAATTIDTHRDNTSITTSTNLYRIRTKDQPITFVTQSSSRSKTTRI